MAPNSARKEKFKFDVRRFAEPIEKYHMSWSRDAHREILEQGDVIERIGDIILPKKNVFLAAEGRSRYVLWCFGERLIQLGYRPYGVGEAFIPPMKNNNTDVLIGSSGTGTSKTVINAGTVAKSFGVPFILLTSYDNSLAAQLATETAIIKGRTKDSYEKDYQSRQLLGNRTEPAGALGSEYEFKSLLFLECTTNYVGMRKGITEKDLADGHRNV